jgi:hypothetical protein
MAKIAKKSITVNYVTFIAGIQISACIKLFTDIYFRDVSSKQFFFIIVAGLLLGISSFLSLSLGSEIDYITRYGELAVGTTLEKKRNSIMDKKLNETITFGFLGEMKRINKVKVLFVSDILLTFLSLGILLISKILI